MLVIVDRLDLGLIIDSIEILVDGFL